MADLGMISLAFGTIVIATVYALGHVGGNHINPAVTLGLAVSGKFPWSQVPGYIAAQVLGAIVGAARSSACSAHKASDVGPRRRVVRRASAGYQAFTAEFVGTFILVFTIFGVIYRKAAPGSPASPSASSCSPRSSRSRRPPARRSTRPAPSVRCSSSRSLGGHVKWEQCPVYLAGRAPRRRRGRPVVRAASRTPRRTAPSAAGDRPRRPCRHPSSRGPRLTGRTIREETT